MNDLIAFLRARLDKDEQVARGFQAGDSWYVDQESGEVAAYQAKPPADRTEIVYVTCDSEGLTPSVEEGAAEHIARQDPARVLREVEAKRRIVDEYDAALRTLSGFRETGYEEGRREALELACRALALPYADHANYREGWKP